MRRVSLTLSFDISRVLTTRRIKAGSSWWRAAALSSSSRNLLTVSDVSSCNFPNVALLWDGVAFQASTPFYPSSQTFLNATLCFFLVSSPPLQAHPTPPYFYLLLRDPSSNCSRATRLRFTSKVTLPMLPFHPLTCFVHRPVWHIRRLTSQLATKYLAPSDT